MFKSKLFGFLSSPFMIFAVVILLAIAILTTTTMGLKFTMAIIIVIVGIPIMIRVTIRTIRQIKEVKRRYTCIKISRMTDLDERISALKGQIEKTPDPNETYNYMNHDFTLMERIVMQHKAALLFCLVIAYIEKGEFETALDYCDEVLAMRPISDDIYTDDEVTYADQCILFISSCLMNQHKFDEAKATLMSVKNKGYRNTAAMYRIDIHLLVLAINSRDTQEARRLLAEVMPEAIRADKRSPEYGILYELKLNEAMIDILENKPEDAKAKLHDIMHNCISQIVRKRAQQLWDEKFMTNIHLAPRPGTRAS